MGACLWAGVDSGWPGNQIKKNVFAPNIQPAGQILAGRERKADRLFFLPAPRENLLATTGAAGF